MVIGAKEKGLAAQKRDGHKPLYKWYRLRGPMLRRHAARVGILALHAFHRPQRHHQPAISFSCSVIATTDPACSVCLTIALPLLYNPPLPSMHARAALLQHGNTAAPRCRPSRAVASMRRGAQLARYHDACCQARASVPCVAVRSVVSPGAANGEPPRARSALASSSRLLENQDIKIYFCM